MLACRILGPFRGEGKSTICPPSMLNKMVVFAAYNERREREKNHQLNESMFSKSSFVVDLVPLFRPTSAFLCSCMPSQHSGIFHSRGSVIFSVSSFASERKTKETELRSSRSPKELLKQVRPGSNVERFMYRT